MYLDILYEVCIRGLVNHAIPFLETVNALGDCFTDITEARMHCHGFPTLDQELKRWDDLPNSGGVLARECLLNVSGFLHIIS